MEELSGIERDLSVKGIADMPSNVYNSLMLKVVKHRDVNPNVETRAFKTVESSLLEQYPTSNMMKQYDPVADKRAREAREAYRSEFIERAHDYMVEKKMTNLPHTVLVQIAEESMAKTLKDIKPVKGASQNFSTKDGKRVSNEDPAAILDMQRK
jgi:hypothetical protein